MIMAMSESTNGISLADLLQGLADSYLREETRVTGICMDSRKVHSSDLFLACHGKKTSGINYIREAINAGAIAIAVEANIGEEVFTNDIPVIKINELSAKVGIIADRFYGHPSKNMNIIGITGTNGKTSVSYFIAQALSRSSVKKVGLIGTLGSGPFAQLRSGLNTTPDPVFVHRTLADFNQQGIDTVIMEVSSHGLDQGRVNGVDFNIGIFTNLSNDHLDYHKDMVAYAAAKKKLFTSHGIKHAIINIDDEYGRKLYEEIGDSIPVIGYGLVDLFPADDNQYLSTMLATVDESDYGMMLQIKSPWGEGSLSVPINGSYNAYNLLASLAALCLIGMNFEYASEQLALLSPVPGRLEKFGGMDKPEIYVDYAHTPDALKKVLITLKRKKPGKLVCIFGCGGNRDKTKRALMGAIAEAYADEVIITNDNPRDEQPDSIIEDILTGIVKQGSVLIETDRDKAITNAILSAGADDIVLIAGKGHETYQEIAGKRYPFSDRQLVRKLLEADT